MRRHTFWWLLNGLIGLTPCAHADMDETTVLELVKNTPCKQQQTIEQVLKDTIKTGSQRDLGWQVFSENAQYEVERAFLINKSMQLRFRWHINAVGDITPVSNRAESLCSE